MGHSVLREGAVGNICRLSSTEEPPRGGGPQTSGCTGLSPSPACPTADGDRDPEQWGTFCPGPPPQFAHSGALHLSPDPLLLALPVQQRHLHSHVDVTIQSLTRTSFACGGMRSGCFKSVSGSCTVSHLLVFHLASGVCVQGWDFMKEVW